MIFEDEELTDKEIKFLKETIESIDPPWWIFIIDSLTGLSLLIIGIVLFLSANYFEGLEYSVGLLISILGILVLIFHFIYRGYRSIVITMVTNEIILSRLIKMTDFMKHK